MAFARTKAPPGRPTPAFCYRCDARINSDEEALLVVESPDYGPAKPAWDESRRGRYWIGALTENGEKGCIFLFICQDCAPEFSHLKEDDEEWVN